MVAAFNPCGFALLPGYLALFLGQRQSTRGVVLRALVVGSSVTAGFIAVFAVVGVAVSALSLTLGPWLSVATLLAGVALLVVGVLLLLGHDVTFRTPRARARVDGSVRGMVAYGVVYATVSLSCTLPVYLAAVVSVFTTSGGSSVVAGVAAMLAYAVSMGLVLTVLAVLVGFAGRASLTRVRAWTRHVGRASGVVVTVVAAYVLWYGWVELQTYNSNTIAPGPVAWVASASATVSQVATTAGPGRVVVALLLVLALVTVMSVWLRGKRPNHAKAPSPRNSTT
ncbi:cytochrome c biogenesis CcdA family protein [Pedococcus sp. NPDC057267]|uniref:cytochrome c biogenesis CcdA family protein n=1 Tax=Pedococcus sp. NPDC057267 TaxID=3346077 RepID=UPI00363FB6A4